MVRLARVGVRVVVATVVVDNAGRGSSATATGEVGNASDGPEWFVVVDADDCPCRCDWFGFFLLPHCDCDYYL